MPSSNVVDENADQSTNAITLVNDEQSSPARQASSAQNLIIPASTSSDDATMPPPTIHANDTRDGTSPSPDLTRTQQEEIPVARLVQGISHGSTDTAHRRRVAEEEEEEEAAVRREFARRMSNMTVGGQDHLLDASVDVVISVEPVDVVPIPHEYDEHWEGGGPFDDDEVSSSISGGSSGSGSGASSSRRSSRRSLTKSEREKQKQRRRRAVTLAVAGLVLVAIIGLAVGVGTSVGASSSNNHDAPSTLSPVLPQQQPLPESTSTKVPLIPDKNENDQLHDNAYTHPIDLSDVEESEELVQLREVLLSTQQKDADTEETLLHDRTTPQYRALYWLANEDAYYQAQLLPWLLDGGLPREDTEYHLEGRILQRYSLAVFYFATSSDGGWGDIDDYLSPKDECEWNAVSCKDKCEWLPNPCDESVYDEDKWAVTSLSLERNNLQGQIPLELFQLTELVELQFRNNHLSGSIPSQIVTLSELDRIDLSRNDLTGTLPEEIGTDADRFGWRYIYLSGNRLTGTLPPAWPFAVHELFLHGNMLSGT